MAQNVGYPGNSIYCGTRQRKSSQQALRLHDLEQLAAALALSTPPLTVCYRVDPAFVPGECGLDLRRGRGSWGY